MAYIYVIKVMSFKDITSRLHSYYNNYGEAVTAKSRLSLGGRYRFIYLTKVSKSLLHKIENINEIKRCTN